MYSVDGSFYEVFLKTEGNNWQYFVMTVLQTMPCPKKALNDKGAELGDVSTSIWIFLNLPSLCIGKPQTDGVLS